MTRVSDKITKKELWKRFLSIDRDKHACLPMIRDIVPKEDWDVKFDWENYEFEPSKEFEFEDNFLGIKEIEGRVFIGCFAGGDWEYPVYFLIYLQDDIWRAYVPKAGNTFNYDIMQAFGNEDEKDLEFFKKVFPREFQYMDQEEYDPQNGDGELLHDLSKMHRDIIANIAVKE